MANRTAAQQAGKVHDRRWLVPAGLVGLIALVAVAYLPALRGQFVWDDDDYITKNETLRDLHGLGRIWFEFGATRQYYPLVYSSFWLENHLWGLRPAGYHVVNILLHSAAAGLLWLVLRRLAIPGAFVAAAVWALHPINVESVAWITERKNVLSGAFYFASALMFLRYELPIANDQLQKRRWGLYSLSIGLFVCALLSKSVTCTLPVALLIVLWWKRGRLTRQDILAVVPFLALGLLLGLTTTWMENTNVGAGGPEWHRPYLVRLATVGCTFWFYLGKIFWPYLLIFIYPKWQIDSGSLVAYLPLLAVGVLFAALWGVRRSIGRGPLATMLYFLATIAPALGMFNIYYAIRYSPVADHFVYLAAIGPIVLMITGLCRILRNMPRPARVAGPTALLLLLAGLTWRQCRVYENLETLWTDTAAKNPEAGIAHHGLGTILQKRGQYAEAQERYERALTTEPHDSKTLFNLGTVLQNQGKLDEAQTRYEAALLLEPDYTKCLVNYGALLAAKGRQNEAVTAFARAITLDPNYALAHENLARALKQIGRTQEAEAEFREAARLKGTH